MSRTFKLSDNGMSVMVYEDGCDEPEIIDSADFIEEHGYDALVGIMTDAQKQMFLPELDQANIAEYYRCLLDVAYKNGRLNQLVGLRNGAIDGAEGAVKAANDYFNNNDSTLVAKITAQRIVYKRALIRLNEVLKTIGFEPLPSEADRAIPEGRISMEKLSELMNKEPRFRGKFRDKIKKHAEDGVAVSVDRLVAEVFASYRKKE